MLTTNSENLFEVDDFSNFCWRENDEMCQLNVNWMYHHMLEGRHVTVPFGSVEAALVTFPLFQPGKLESEVIFNSACI